MHNVPAIGDAKSSRLRQ